MSKITIKDVIVETESGSYGYDSWIAYDENYDGAEDSSTCNMYGTGRTEKAAVNEYLEKFEDYYGVGISDEEREQIFSQLGDK